jgi:hypothetical protein
MNLGFDINNSLLHLTFFLTLLVTSTEQRQRPPLPSLIKKLNDRSHTRLPVSDTSLLNPAGSSPLSGNPLDPDQNQNPQPAVPIRRNAKVCDRCTDMYHLADREFRMKNNQTLFCIRLLQIKRCIRKIPNDCNLILVLSLGTGVNYRQRANQCSKMKIKHNDVPIPTPNPPPKKKHRHCKYRQRDKKLSKSMHCGMFGDPHLKTYYDVRQTCIVDGAWTLVDNDFLTVQVTNKMVQDTGITTATATTKISIVFKQRKRSCIQQKIYEATSEYLPTLFKDGTHTTGTRCKTHIRKKRGEVVLRDCRSNTTILIRRIGKYLTFNILSPFEIVKKSSGLCTTGCPATELVDYRTVLQDRISNQVHATNNQDGTVDTAYAMSKCASQNLTDFWYDSCMFDLLTTGDRQFTRAARVSMIDAINMDPKLRLRRSDSVVLTIMNDRTSSSGRRLTLSSSCLLLLTLCTLLARHANS